MTKRNIPVVRKAHRIGWEWKVRTEIDGGWPFTTCTNWALTRRAAERRARRAAAWFDWLDRADGGWEIA